MGTPYDREHSSTSSPANARRLNMFVFDLCQNSGDTLLEQHGKKSYEPMSPRQPRYPRPPCGLVSRSKHEFSSRLDEAGRYGVWKIRV
jgi:hypothetical protein